MASWPSSRRHCRAMIGPIAKASMNTSQYLLSTFAGVCLLTSGCSFRQGYIDDQEDLQLSKDHSAVDSTQQGYEASLLESGLYSGETRTASSDLHDAERKLEIDQRQSDNYQSASGQSSEPRE